MADRSLRVTALSVTPVKGLRVNRPEQVTLQPDGIVGDRRFYLIDDRGRMVNGKHHGTLNEVTAQLETEDRLVLGFPDGRRVAGRVEPGEPIPVAFRSEARTARPLLGAFSEALSDHVGVPLRVVVPADGSLAIDRGRLGAVTLVSAASIGALASFAGGAPLDARRFRMSIEIDGAGAFEEDAWLGRELRVGEARIRPCGHVGRCIVTSMDPETGAVDVPTLDLLRDLRADAGTTEPLALGVWGSVLSPGTVAIGDELRLGDTAEHADLAGGR